MDGGFGMNARMAGLAHSLKQNLKAVTLADAFDARVLGFALSLAWSFVVFFSTVVHFSTRNDVSHLNSVVGFSNVGMLLVFVAGALAPRVISRIMEHSAARWAVPVSMAVCTLVLVVVDHDVIRQPWCSMASTAAGAGLGVLYLVWGNEFRHFSAAQAAVKASSAFLLSAGLFALVVALPRPVAIAATVAMALAIGAVMQVVKPRKAVVQPEQPKLKRGAFLLRALLSLGVLSFAESFMRALFFNATPIISEGSYPWLLLVATVASIALICVPLLSSSEPDYASAYQTVVFSLGFIFLLLPILDLGTVPSDILALTTCSIVMLLTWIVLSRITGLYRLSAPFAFGVGWGAYVAGALAGTFGGALLASFRDLGPRDLSLVALLGVCLLFFGYLFLFTEKSMVSLVGGDSPDERQPFRSKCAQIARRCDLTEREAEIMVLVAKGRSLPRIQKSLGLTAGTVNTHLTHLYRKLDVHDKQELIDLVESEPLARPKLS